MVAATICAGKAIKDIPRDQVVIASKWGVMKDEQGKYTQDNTADYARKSLEGSLKRLGVDYIDLYIMRSWDHKTPIEESVKGMAVSSASHRPACFMEHLLTEKCLCLHCLSGSGTTRCTLLAILAGQHVDAHMTVWCS